ncbi:MAG: insulinase family protein [Muribaculaceae bacterium]|nr:insulinase family protein [Muribaculaceae bacterium]
MKKRVFSILLAVMAIVLSTITVNAQMPQLTPLPEMPGVRTGKLDNGLTYYVLQNKKPEGRANFYIAQKVGSTLETKEQLGLAHFLEHMAFNGTVTYPGKAMLTYLQDKGIRFGADINAYTSWDETVYNIDNVPTADKNLVDSVLLVLRDWSCNLLLEDDEIEAERGVIQEEWRMRNDVQTRQLQAMLPAIYQEYQYQQSPIGTMDVVMNFKPDVLRDYYHKWYRPDQQGIVVVGDFDPEEMEKKVIELFSPIKMPENVPERTYAEVSDNTDLIYFEFEDPEVAQSYIVTSFKSDPIPFEMRNTAEMYIQAYLVQEVLTGLLNNRLDEYAHEPECKYQGAGVRFDSFYVSPTKDAFSVTVLPKDDLVAAYKDAMSVVARACQTGFTDSELERVISEMTSSYEKAYNERDKTRTENLARELIRHFIDNTPAPGPEVKYQVVAGVLPQIPAAVYNEVAKQLLTPTNQVIVVTEAQAPGKKLPGKEMMQQTLNEVLSATYEAYVDEVITEPLLKSTPVAGTVVSETPGKFESTELMLSNGVKVVVKPTDFSNDQILLMAWREGGQTSYPVSEAPNLQMIDNAFECSRLGNFDVKTLTKYLAGKQVSLGLTVGQETFSFSGGSTVKDLPTLMEILYASMNELSADQKQYDILVDQIARQYDMMASTPDFIFQKAYTKAMWGDNPMTNVPSVETIKAADYPAMVKMIQDATANAADYTMVIVGNVDLNVLRPLLEKYVASLPSTGVKTERPVVTPIALQEGNVINDFNQTVQSPIVKYFGGWDGNLTYNAQNISQVEMLGSILSNIFTLTIREEMGASYSPGAGGMMVPATNQWLIYYLIDTNAEMGQAAYDRAVKEYDNLVDNGAKADMFGQVREAALNQLDIAQKTNNYWLSGLRDLERGHDMITGHVEFLKNLTLNDFNAFIKANCQPVNSMVVKMNGVTSE